MSGESSEEKKHPASDTKLNKQRKQGQVPQAQEASGFFGTAAALAALIGVGAACWQILSTAITVTPTLIALPFAEAREVASTAVMRLTTMAILPIAAAALPTSLVLTLIQNKGFVFAMKPVTPDFKRVSVSGGAKRVYGKRGRKEVVMGATRLTVWMIFATGLSALWLPSLFRSVQCDVSCMSRFILPVGTWFIAGAIVMLLLCGGASVVLQRKIFLHEQRMTDTEQKREKKDQFGSPEIRKARDRLRNQSGGAGATRKVTFDRSIVVISSPEGMVGVVYDPPDFQLPLVTGKCHADGDLQGFEKMTRDLGIRIVEEPDLARVLLRVPKGDMVPRERFAALGAVFQRL